MVGNNQFYGCGQMEPGKEVEQAASEYTKSYTPSWLDLSAWGIADLLPAI